MKFYHKLPLSVANVDLEVYNRSPIKDRTTCLAIGWAIVIAGAVASGAFYYFLYLLTNSKFMAIGGAAIMLIIVYLLDRTLLRDESRAKLAFRITISLVIALFISVPLKVKLGEEAINSYIVQDASRHNQELREQVNDVRKGLQTRKLEIDKDIMRYSERDANNRITQAQKLVEARRLKVELLENWDERIAEVEADVAGQKITAIDSSFVAQMTTFLDLTMHPEKSNEPMAFYLNLIIFFLFAITEALPSILRATMQDSLYIRAVAHKNRLVHAIQSRLEEVQNMLVEKDSLEGNQTLLKKQSYFTEMAKQASFELKSTKELEQLHLEFMEAVDAYEREQEERYNKTQKTPSNGQVATDEEPEFVYK